MNLANNSVRTCTDPFLLATSESVYYPVKNSCEFLVCKLSLLVVVIHEMKSNRRSQVFDFL
jgi:hypothetical protein